MPPNHFESEVESFLEGSHGDRTHIKQADHHTVTPLCGTLLDYKVLSPIVEEVLKPEYDCLFGVACADLRKLEVQDSLEKLRKYIAKHFRPIRDEVAGRKVASDVSPVLITKILMGTLGCVPAYDRFFQDGVATYKVTTQEYSLESVRKLAKFYEAHNDRLEEARRGMRVGDLIYPQMKLLDMGFWQVGFEKDARDAK